MIVDELIAELKEMPQDAKVILDVMEEYRVEATDVYYEWDGREQVVTISDYIQKQRQ